VPPLRQRPRGRLRSVPSAHTAYLVHAPVIVAVAWEFRGLTWYPVLKWLLAALVAVPACFALSALIRKIPYTDRVL
jgi:surface polysaccharide O-acyltransferase-like enzyme